MASASRFWGVDLVPRSLVQPWKLVEHPKWRTVWLCPTCQPKRHSCVIPHHQVQQSTHGKRECTVHRVVDPITKLSSSITRLRQNASPLTRLENVQFKSATKKFQLCPVSRVYHSVHLRLEIWLLFVAIGFNTMIWNQI